MPRLPESPKNCLGRIPKLKNKNTIKKHIIGIKVLHSLTGIKSIIPVNEIIASKLINPSIPSM